MLVNAHAYPYAAMFQGVGMIGAVIWGIWYTTRSNEPRKLSKEEEEELNKLIEVSEKRIKNKLKEHFDRVGNV